jgi:hypothetical protein
VTSSSNAASSTRKKPREIAEFSSIEICAGELEVNFVPGGCAIFRVSAWHQDLGQVFTAVGKKEQAWSFGGQAQRAVILR